MGDAQKVTSNDLASEVQASKKIIRCCHPKKKMIYKIFPILQWLPKYTKMQAVSDLIAGVTLGLTMIPQSIAYATLAGLTAQYGLYSSFVGGFMYMILGKVKEISIGPTSLMAILTIEFTRGMPVEFVILLTFLSGCIEFTMGLLNLGFLVDFISIPVTSGFMSATSVIIIISQLQGFFGLRIKGATTLIGKLFDVISNLHHIQLGDTLLGVSSVVLLLSLRKLKDIKFSEDTKTTAIIKKICWFLSVGRNALIVVTCSFIAYHLTHEDQSPFVLSGKVASGLPSVNFPPFTAQVGNQTYTFGEMCSHLSSGLIILPLVAVLANVAIAKSFASGMAVDASQEMRTLGLCNLLGSCVSSMPTAGAFTRSAVSNASGVQTPMAGLYSGLMTILALSFLTPYFYYIPKAVLAAVLITAVLFMINYQIVKLLWSGSRRDAITTIGTFVGCLAFNVEAGLLLGVLSNVIYLLYLSARPHIEATVCKTSFGHQYLLIKPDVGLLFPAADFLAENVSKISQKRGHGKMPVVIDCESFRGIDYTAVKAIERLAKDFQNKQHNLWFLNLSPSIEATVKHLVDMKSVHLLENEAKLGALLYASVGEMAEIGKNPPLPLVFSVNEKSTPLTDVALSAPHETESLLVNRTRVENNND